MFSKLRAAWRWVPRPVTEFIVTAVVVALIATVAIVAVHRSEHEPKFTYLGATVSA